MSPSRNLLILMSDEHARRVAGCYGDVIISTPNLDALAARGTRFTSAYSTSPICVPARAAMATGLPPHLTGYWDNAHPYEGRLRSWMHDLHDAGRQVVSIGKLHYRSTDAPTGFSPEILPMHVAGGTGDISGSVRDPLPVRKGSRKLAEALGPGETSYTKYDRAVRDAAIDWLAKSGRIPSPEGWTLKVSFVAPHFPLVAPTEWYDRYAGCDLMPRRPAPDSVVQHPWLAAMRACYAYDNFSDDRRRLALQSYYALVSFLDDNIGQVLRALEESGQAEQTDILYLSDHGDNLGERGLWGKSTFFEDSAGIPMILSVAGQTTGRVCRTPVSLLDIYPTALEAAGLSGLPAGANSQSLFQIAAANDDPDRPVFGEYHAAGAMTGAFMLRQGRFKLIRYQGLLSQLFDLKVDPYEETDLACEAAMTEELQRLESVLDSFVDSGLADLSARQSQDRLITRHGGRDVVLGDGGFTATPVPVAAD